MRIAGAVLAAGVLGLLWLFGAPGSLLVFAGLMFAVVWCLPPVDRRPTRRRAASGDGGGGYVGDGGGSRCGDGDSGGGDGGGGGGGD